jgi:hypothetical protein
LPNIPEYLRQIEFKSEFDKEGRAAKVSKAQEMLERAEAEGTLTATQLLVARIRMIQDDAPEEELKKQEVLLAEFVRTQPAEYIGWLGNKFMKKEHWRPARTLLKHYLLHDPDNVSIRLNVGYIGLSLGLWEEAEAGADLVLTNPGMLSPYGMWVAYQQKAVGALHRGDYNTSILFAEKAFASHPSAYELLLIQLAAASTGDVAKFYDASARLKEKLPEKYEAFKLQVDSAEALLLVRTGQEEAARAIVARWSQKDRAEGRLKHYWSEYPAIKEVIENWVRLATPQN